MVEFLKQHKILVGLSIFTIAVVYIFFPVLGQYAALHAPDSMPFFIPHYGKAIWNNMLSGDTVAPQSLYWLVLNPLYAHEVTYIIDSLILALAGVYYLRGRKVHPLAAWCGGLALGFSGYTFTLFCAGHRGYFHMISSVVWAFGLLDRGFRTKKLFYFGMLGLIFAWGITYQPDVFIMIGVVAGLYALWLTFVADSGFKRTALIIWPRFLLMLLFLVLAGYGAIYTAVTKRIADRRSQIVGVDVRAKKQQKADVDTHINDLDKQQQWIFATNWSLPPEDVLEFFVPGVFGNESFNGTHPYWGRLGRPHKTQFRKGGMMPNYRQHTVYLGIIAFVFAFFAVICGFRCNKKETEETEEDENDDSDVLRDIPFWAVIWLVALVFAMGRYTPVYRLFYAIPYMDLIRAPVKFMHLTEIASAFLCGFGVHLLLASQVESVKLKRMLLWLAGCVAGLLVVSALFFMLGGGAFVNYVKELGSIANAESVGSYALQNIGRSFVFLVLATGCCLLGIASKKWRGGALLAVLVLIVIDQSTVAKRYVKAMDVTPFYTENAVIKAIKSAAADTLPQVISYAPGSQRDDDWFSRSLYCNGIVNLKPKSADADKPYGRLFAELGKNPVRLWQGLNVKHIILPLDSASELVKAGIADPLLTFEIGAGVVRSVSQQSQNTCALLALRSTEIKPRLLTNWQGGVEVSEHVEHLKTSKLVVSDAVMNEVQSPESEPVMKVLFENPLPGSYTVGVQTASAVESLLVFNQRVSDKYEIRVDGQPQTANVADGIWMAAKLPPGENEVVLQRKKDLLPLVLSCAAILGCFVFLTRLPRSTNGRAVTR